MMIFKNNMKNNYDIVFSYLSKKILKKKFLKKTKFYNINFHPGCSKYPGIGCFNFALLNNESSYGVTAHLINENIDSGQIIKEKRFKIDKKFNVEKLSNKSYFELFKLFKQVVIAVKNKKIKFSKIKWKKKAYTRKDLEKIAEIKINIIKFFILLFYNVKFYFLSRFILKKYNIDNIILATDRGAPLNLSIVKFAKKFNIKIWNFSDGLFANSNMISVSRRNKPNYIIKENSVTLKLFKNYCHKYNKQIIIYFDRLHIYLNKIFNILPKNPWLPGGGLSDYFLVQNKDVRKYYKKLGCKKYRFSGAF